MPTRRRLLTVCGCLGASVVAGCLGAPSDTGGTGTTDDTATPTTSPEDCLPAERPAPSDASSSPRPYPDRPDELTAETVETYVRAFERAYRYNSALADDQRKVGRTNAVTVSVADVAVESTADGFAATVSGAVRWEILDAESTPETPTATPLPMGQRPFEASYTVASGTVRRDGVVVAC
ncbi:hypothetical protein [Haloarcula marina]|uniref:hypothetical protein n=1 Tax=Haloarcula marina TaxID=2961574 RepID=UPI0020B8E151|nr:hypothetical protein [Halomicroarcula marina]